MPSGKDFDGNTVGRAWVGAVCDGNGFASCINRMTLGVTGISAVLFADGFEPWAFERRGRATPSTASIDDHAD